MESGKRQGTLGTRYEEGGMREMVDQRIATAAIRVNEESGGIDRDRIYNARWAFKYFIIETELEIVLLFAGH